MNKEDYDYRFYAEKFGWNLRQWRKSLNISQEELSYNIGVDRKTISNWESGNGLPKMKQYIQLCIYMALPLGGVFDMKNDNDCEIEEFENFSYESIIEEAYENKEYFETSSYFSALLVETDDPYAKDFIGKSGVLEILYSLQSGDRIICFSLLNSIDSHFISERIRRKCDVNMISNDVVLIRTCSYHYIFKTNNNINRFKMELFIMDTHSPRVVRWGVLVGDDLKRLHRMKSKVTFL